MKSTLKLITAAVAMAVSGSAFAAAGDIVVAVYDPLSGQDIIMDTGVSLLTAAPTSTTTIQVASQYGATWTSFANAVASKGESLSALQYTAISGTGTASNGTVELSYLIPPVNGFGAGAMNANATVMDGAPGTTVLASIIAPDSATTGWALTVGTTNDYGGQAGTVATALTGTTMGLYNVTDTRAGSSISQTPIADITFNGSSITISAVPTAAVPEPGSFALMGAGLLAIGALVRRRTRG